MLRRFLDRQAKLFEKGGKLEKAHAVYEATDTFLYTPGQVTKGASHVRDAIDLKRLMVTVVVALIPCVFMAMYNTGRQAHLAIQGGALPLETWQTTLMERFGLAFDPASLWANVVHGALYYLPVLLVTFVVGGHIEMIFAIIRKHEINEGFLVTGMLFPLILPPTIPLWQVAIGIAFGVVIGKEVFGGTGMNILNPALTARVFLFFAYPGQISGDAVWIAARTSPDGYSGATMLGRAALGGQQVVESSITWMQAFLGDISGSMGETSALACLIGAAILLATGVGSWRIMLSCAAGSIAIVLVLNAFPGSGSNPMLSMPFWWHLALGGWAFGAVFMATDPVSAAQSNTGRVIYGFLIGVLAILIRTINPAFPEGMMLAILFMNVFSSLIDHYVVKANIKRRRARLAT
ncbi:MAG TPA: NADH:ubiquinone reductase (Na(+)-transporting) subunit B [Thermoanaerobaculia bacterium]|nr:NADH:ubiquinone reductase (Na(+)-transporting) subunit B [Thermoanaerobaculia bacterium]